MRFICILFSLSASIIFAACSPKETDNIQKTTEQTSYYTETNLALPENYEFTSILCVSESEPGILEIVASTKKESALVFHYNIQKGEWSKPQSLVPSGSDLVMNAIPLKNGSYYIECSPNEQPDMEYYTVDAKGTMHQLAVTNLKSDTGEFFSLHGLFAIEEGIVCTSSDGTGNYYLIDKNTGNPLVDFNKNNMRYDSQAFCFKDDFIILSTNGENELIETYNLKTGEKKENDNTMSAFLSERINSLFLPSDTEIIRLNSEGISSFSTDTYENNVLLNSKNMEYSQEGTSLYGAYLCQNKDIVTWQSTGPFDWSISLFTYSDIGKKETYTTLNVYMLYDDIIPDYLYSEFESKHPNIKLNLQYGSTDASAITTEDAIKILNTELSAGKGPDILLLDGLPVTSYISKGMLEPIDEVLKGLPSDSHFENVIKCYSIEDTTYALPMGFTIPAILSPESVIENDSSLETFTSEVEKLSGEMVLSKSVYANTVSILYDVYFDSCFKEGKVDKKLLNEFYLNCEKLWNNAAYHKSDEPFDFTYSPNINSSISTPLVYAAYADSKVNVGTVDMLQLFHELKGLSHSHNLSWKILGNTFLPRYSYGVSSNSKHKKEALEFLEYILSDGQSFLIEKGLALPTEKELFMKDLSEEKKSEFVGLGNISTDKLVEIPAPKFEENESNKLLQELEQAQLSQYNNPEMKTLILENFASYINKEMSLDTAINSTFNKVNIMLKE